MQTHALVLAIAALAVTGCSIRLGPPKKASAEAAVDLGLEKGFSAQVVAEGLNNPSSVAFSPQGVLAVCDSGNGRVVLVQDGEVTDHITGFTTEHWKVDAKTGQKRFKLGPLSAIWLGKNKIAVTDAGLPDGEEVVRFYTRPGKASAGRATNPIGPTSDDPADNGEGNLTGMVRGPGGRSIYLCGQGADAKTWLLRCDVTARRLLTFASADDAGLDVNSAMQCLMTDHRSVLVLYSGAGGKPDGVIGEWDTKTGDLVASWSLPGLVDPMGMAWIPGTRELAVVDNNWNLEKVQMGRLARVSLTGKGGTAKVTILGTKLMGPVACAFGPDRRLYVAELGEMFDQGKGRIVAISGF